MIAACVGSFRLFEFVALNCIQLRAIFGDIPILVSDDESDQSPRIAKMCADHGIHYLKSNIRRGHFAGDFQAIVNSIQFAKAMKADIAIKVSQRFILKSPKCKDVIEEAFHDPNICFALPGRMSIKTIRQGGAASFTQMPILSDILCFRADCFDSAEMIKEYKDKCEHGDGFLWSKWVESFCLDLRDKKFKDRTYTLELLTNHYPNSEQLYLRRNQNTQGQYLELARKFGLFGNFDLSEWSRMEKGYWPAPLSI